MANDNEKQCSTLLIIGEMQIISTCNASPRKEFLSVGLWVPSQTGHRVRLLREAGHRKLTILSHTLAGRVTGLRQALGHHSRSGKAESDAWDSWRWSPAMRPSCLIFRLSDTQVPLWTTEELRVEWGPTGWISPEAWESVLSFMAVMGLSLA